MEKIVKFSVKINFFRFYRTLIIPSEKITGSLSQKYMNFLHLQHISSPAGTGGNICVACVARATNKKICAPHG